MTRDWLDEDRSEEFITQENRAAALIQKTLEEEPKVSFVDEAGMINVAELDGRDIRIKELGKLNTGDVIKDLFVAQEFILVHFES